MMSLFFGTFFRVLAFFLAISAFFLIIFLISSYLDNNKFSSNYIFKEGDKNSENIIAILKLNGPIVNSNFSLGNLNFIEIIDPDSIRKNLEQIKLIKPKILIISINSPGGTVSASYEAYQIFSEFKKETNLELYFHTKEVITSGAYWLALSGDGIYANYGSLVGSIGVRGPDWIYFNNPTSISSGIFGNSIETKNGIEVFSQKAGKSKDLLNPFRKPTEEEINKLQSMVDQIYEDFANTVSKERKIEKTTLINEIGALVFNANIAKKNYLIDEVINLDSLIKEIARNKKFNDFQIFENFKKGYNIFDNYFFNLINEKIINNNTMFNNVVCSKLKKSITTISDIYLLSC